MIFVSQGVTLTSDVCTSLCMSANMATQEYLINAVRSINLYIEYLGQVQNSAQSNKGQSQHMTLIFPHLPQCKTVRYC